jgi:hypothetical protein
VQKEPLPDGRASLHFAKACGSLKELPLENKLFSVLGANYTATGAAILACDS